METCFYCSTPILDGRIERDHFPVPASCGGTVTVPTCQQCHDLKDRISWRDIPLEMKAEFLEEIAGMSRIGKILIAKMLAAWFHAKL